MQFGIHLMRTKGRDCNPFFSTTNSELNYERVRIFILSKFQFACKYSFKAKPNKQTRPYELWGATTVRLDTKYNFSEIVLFTLSL